jgi:hypothetical protein
VEALRGVFAVQITSDFSAKEAACDRMGGVAAKLRTAALLIDIDEERAAVRAVESADGMADLGQGSLF